MSRSLLAVFAHPDDETFSVGGTLARLHCEGVRTALVCATDGDRGRSDDGTAGAALARTRRRELLEAAAVLGVDRVYPGGFPDGGLPTHDPVPMLELLVRAVRETRPDVIVTFGPEGGPNRHADHEAISRLATAAFFLAGNPSVHRDLPGAPAAWSPRRLYYTTWPDADAQRLGWPRGLPITCSVNVEPFLETKREAFARHRSQRHHAATLEQTVTPYEHYALAADTSQPVPVSDDLFAGM